MWNESNAYAYASVGSRRVRRRMREVREQQLREQKVAQVVDAELQLEAVVGDRAP